MKSMIYFEGNYAECNFVIVVDSVYTEDVVYLFETLSRYDNEYKARVIVEGDVKLDLNSCQDSQSSKSRIEDLIVWGKSDWDNFSDSEKVKISQTLKTLHGSGDFKEFETI